MTQLRSSEIRHIKLKIIEECVSESRGQPTSCVEQIRDAGFVSHTIGTGSTDISARRLVARDCAFRIDTLVYTKR